MTGAAREGALVVVGTPIGNLGDLTPRARQALAMADVIYCEDTRRTRALLTHAGIRGSSLRSLHAHNETERIDEVLDEVRQGRTVALASDAGMPGISDPGTKVVAAAAVEDLQVRVVPGPSAVTAALVASGLPTARFCFEGFLPRSGKARRELLASVAKEPRTTVLFESPKRVAGTLADLAAACGGERRVVIARELTKVHEEIWRGSLSEAVERVREVPVRGEVVVVVDGREAGAGEEVDDARLTGALADRLGQGTRTREVVDEVAAAFGVSKRRVYDLALALRHRDADGG